MFQKSILEDTKQDQSKVALQWAAYQNHFNKIDFIKTVKKEKYQEGFLKNVKDYRIFHIFDENNKPVSFFVNSSKNFSKQINKKSKVSRSARESGYFSILSSAEPFRRQAGLMEEHIKIFTKTQFHKMILLFWLILF